ncbi:hypothetical protein [Archangium lansingense]|uniref:Uncharacterized protein n=1 Tax=Archangium lansingense TaxID=2995310 RepID=A0ABT4ADT1_9BACT|nr:hypothetical protein [Archangium lansinium]MCY1079815.1 hypothetical protein [Archangium lansinium]
MTSRGEGPGPESIEHRVQQVTGTPPLSQRQFAVLFQILAATLGEHPFHLNSTSKVVRDRLVAGGERISRESVCLVLKGIMYRTDSIPVRPENMSVLELAQTFARNVIHFCGRAQLELLPEDRARIEDWLIGGLLAPRAPEDVPLKTSPGAHPVVRWVPVRRERPPRPSSRAPAPAPPLVEPGVYLSRAEPLLLELESSWERGAPEPALEECSSLLAPNTLDSYWERIHRGAPPPFRRVLVTKLLKQLAHDVRPPQQVFRAREVIHQAPPSAEPGAQVPSRAGLFIESPGVPQFRPSQAFAARHWGVWYVLDTPESQARLEASWARHVISMFETNLRAMNRLPASFRLDKMLGESETVGPWFEQLILDLLNEEQHVARRASLLEDLFEKTDLRVRYPTLKRKRGARVQVTLITDEELHGTKLRRIAHSDELVVVSPLKLAEAALGLAEMPPLTQQQKDDLFAALSRPAPSVRAVAAALKRHFLQALGHPASPLGPVLAVAAPVRRFIRMYVEHKAHDSTQHLRKREDESEVILFPPSRWMR